MKVIRFSNNVRINFAYVPHYYRRGADLLISNHKKGKAEKCYTFKDEETCKFIIEQIDYLIGGPGTFQNLSGHEIL